MNLRQIEILHAVYASGSVTVAARELHVSQASVSKMLRHAERQVRFPVCERFIAELRKHLPKPTAGGGA